MSAPSMGDASTIIGILIVSLGGCFGLINAFFFFTLRGIKKNIDDLWSKRNQDHDDIAKIKGRLKID